MTEKAVKIGKWKVNKDVLLGAGAVATIAIAAATFARMGGRSSASSASSSDPYGLGGGSGDTGGPPNVSGWPWPSPPSSAPPPAAPPWYEAPPAPSAPPLPPAPTASPLPPPPVAAPHSFATPGAVPAGEDFLAIPYSGAVGGWKSTGWDPTVRDAYTLPAAVRGGEGGFVDPATGAFFPGRQFAGYTGPNDLPAAPTVATSRGDRN